ncbi:MAG TPA: cobalt ECF transporter T component CbiQ, partial [Ilumatobacter sp.]|nr:cobalt ECF transporter T component CbiQ [Ilumatobacter sp.]
MANGHAGDHHHLHVPGSTPVHRLSPDAKVAGLVLFVVVVALTPRRAVWAFGVDAALLVAIVAAARIPLRVLVTRLSAVVPFVAFAVFIPFVAGGEQVDVLGASLSTEGLWSTWNIVVKALIGTTASIVLSATTPIPDIVHGLSRLRFPAVMVSIIAFMFRYLDVVVDQLTRMRRSMTARCHDPRWLWQARPIAASAGAVFVRSYERGERVHQAMLVRGFDGQLPV